MKKTLIFSLLVATFSFAGRIVDANNSSSSSSEHSEEASSDDESSDESSEEFDDDGDDGSADEMELDFLDDDRDHELPLDFGGVLHQMEQALQPRSFFHGEVLIPHPRQVEVERPQKRPSDDSDDRPTKKKRVQSEDSIQERLQMPMPAVGGILGALLDFGTPTWEEPFFGGLDVLDILSLGAVNHQANRRIPNNLVLTIHYHAELDRLLALPARAAAFAHLAELNFDVVDAEDEDDARIIDFLTENAAALTNLRHLTFEPSDELSPLQNQILHTAIHSESLARLLLQTRFLLDVTVVEEELTEFFELLAAAQRFGLNTLLDLRIYDDERDLHRWFMERFPVGVAVHGLHFQGATFGDEAMRLLSNRLHHGVFPGLRELTFTETGLKQRGYNLLGRIIVRGWISQIRRLEIDNGDVADEMADDEALGSLFNQIPPQGRLDTLLPHLTEFTFYASAGGFIADSSIHEMAAFLGGGGLPALRTLRLTGALTDNYIETLIHIAPRLQRLRTLDLRGNPEITLPAVLRLQEALPRCKVQSDLS